MTMMMLLLSDKQAVILSCQTSSVHMEKIGYWWFYFLKVMPLKHIKKDDSNTVCIKNNDHCLGNFWSCTYWRTLNRNTDIKFDDDLIQFLTTRYFVCTYLLLTTIYFVCTQLLLSRGLHCHSDNTYILQVMNLIISTCFCSHV